MKRYELFDTIRGITLFSMIFFHACWDLWYFGLGITTEFLYGTGAYIWQQSICWTFILLSGFCFSFGHHPLRRGLTELGCGILITVVTYFVVPDALDLFGVLWLLGSCTLIMAGSERIAAILIKKPAGSVSVPGKNAGAAAGIAISFAFFILTRNVNGGSLGFEKLNILKLPESLYRNHVTAFFGFPHPAFYSSDYFSLIPWFFLYLTGYFLHKAVFGNDGPKAGLKKTFEKGIRPFSFAGRHSLLVYMLHQPVLYGIIMLISAISG